MSLDPLKKEWTALYRIKLPSLAKQRSPAQSKWPVYLDHCFARIILDNAVGRNEPWMQVVKSPAVNHMTKTQLQDAIEMGEKIAEGKLDLVELDNRSLELRGKKKKRDARKKEDKLSKGDEASQDKIEARRRRKKEVRKKAAAKT